MRVAVNIYSEKINVNTCYGENDSYCEYLEGKKLKTVKIYNIKNNFEYLEWRGCGYLQGRG